MSRAKMYTLYGYTMTLPMWCAYVGINYDTVVHRMRSGLSLEDALTTPVRRPATPKVYNVGGRCFTMTELSSQEKIGLGNLRIRVATRGLSEALDEWNNSKNKSKNEILFQSAMEAERLAL